MTGKFVVYIVFFLCSGIVGFVVPAIGGLVGFVVVIVGFVVAFNDGLVAVFVV